VFGQRLGADFNVDKYSTHHVNAAPYVACDLPVGPIRIEPGVRLNTFLFETQRSRPRIGTVPDVGFSDAAFPLEPRVSLGYTLSPQVSWSASAGHYHRLASPFDQSAVFGTPQLRLANATHFTLRQETRLGETARVAVIGFATNSERLPVRNPETSPRTSQVLVQTGESKSRGVQTTVRVRISPAWNAWLSWTTSRSERRANSSSAFRLFDRDQPHVASAGIGTRLGAWSFAAQGRYASGAPRTPVAASTYNVSLGRYEPLFGPTNSDRLPDTFQLDVRVDRRWRIATDTMMWLYLDALNVTAHRNAEEFVYDATFSERATFTGLPPIAVFGVRVER
jgi:hypothetical protein